MFGASDQLGMLDGVVRRVLELRPVEPHEFHQVAALHQAVDVENFHVLLEPQLGSEHAAMDRRHGGADLKAHGGRKLAVAQFGLDDLQQVVGLFLVALHDRVARDSEQVPALDVQLGQEQVEIVGNDVFERDEVAAIPDAHEARDAFAHWHLDAHQARAGLAGSAVDADQQVEREVGDEREGVGGVHARSA